MQSTQKEEETDYEKNQRFNSLVSWLHSFRQKNILMLCEAVARRTEGKRIKVVDIGCAHAKLFSILNKRFEVDYTGIEIAPIFVEAARSRYAHNPNFRVIHESAVTALPYLKNVDVIVALETFEHILEHEVVRIIEAIATAQPNLFVCSVHNMLWLLVFEMS